MKIEPGEYLLVHYDFPTYEVTFSNEDVKRGIAMSIPEANCSIKLPSSDAGAVGTITMLNSKKVSWSR